MGSCSISILSVARTEKCKHLSEDLKWVFLKSISDVVPVLLGYNTVTAYWLPNASVQHSEEKVPHPHCCKILKTELRCVTQ